MEAEITGCACLVGSSSASLEFADCMHACAPKMTRGDARGRIARIETQAPEIPAPPDQLPDAPGALCAGSSTGNGAPVGRGVQHTSVSPPSLEDLAKRVREAVARGDFDLARELIDEAACSGFGR